MRTVLFGAVLVTLLAVGPSARADEYVLDEAHSGVNFKISHIGLSWTFGRFKEVSGSCTLDAAAPAKSAFNLTIKADSIDTNNQKRDDHLKSPDFFNATQFPTITFKSTAVKPVEGGLEVTGDFTMHGVTKAVTF